MVINRNIVERIYSTVEHSVGQMCCVRMDTALGSNSAVGPRLLGGDLAIGKMKLQYCPFCGVEVTYNDVVTPPPGYVKI